MNIRALRWCGILLVVLPLLVSCDAAPDAPQTSAGVATAQKKTYQDLVVGFSQIGAESEWRTANTRSIQETAQRLGVELKFADAQQQQENQIKAIRSFIAQRVDVIGVSPVLETGWDTVFAEAKKAGIPLILVDRGASVPDDLFSAFIGSDFVQEGQRACAEMARLLNGQGNIIELEGTVGSTPQIDRRAGFEQCLKDYPGMHVTVRQSGDFIRARGKEVMKTILREYGRQFNALFAQNDDMALGAIEALEEEGLKPGVDIKIVSIDAERAAFEAMIAGKLNVTIECSPLLGPQFFETALKLANGEPIEKWVKSNESIFRQDNATLELPKRQY
ncbi:MAG: ABC transporter substrate-binding protein [Chloroflexi bacterium]|nr:ABC transporter substrate-binding protein [Chloroflexota bacterium]OJV90627.1 MAG: LacI family transcriptional regulator [Chloroflexi bacterium 54-19]